MYFTYVRTCVYVCLCIYVYMYACNVYQISFIFYSFFWVISRRLNFICRRFGTLCSIFIGGVSIYTFTAYEDGTDRVFRNVGI